MMSKDIKSKPAPEFPENIFHGFAGLRVQFDIVLMFIIPREDLAQITFRPAEGPPVADHLNNIIVRHLQQDFAFTGVIVD